MTSTPETVCVVTGASTGIGREVAHGLARLGHRVLMVSRDPGRAAAALEQVKQSGPNVESLVADLSLLSEAQRVVKEVKARTSKLHLLVNCAAVVPAEKRVSPEGFETAWAANVLSVFLLTTALKDLLAAAAPSRVVNFYGGNARGFDFDNLQGEKGYDGWTAYGQTKVANALLTQEFARRFQGTGITVTAAWPGIVNTEGMRAMPGGMKWFAFFARPLMKSPAKGAVTPLWLSTTADAAQVNGKAFGTMSADGKKELKLPAFATDPASAARVYALCEQACARFQ